MANTGICANMRGWRLRTLLARSLVVDGEQYVYLSASEGPEGSAEEDPLDGHATGSHASFCFMGVPRSSNCPDCGELERPVRLNEMQSDVTDSGLPVVIIRLDPDAALEAGIPSTIFIEFEDRLTVEEYLVADTAAS